MIYYYQKFIIITNHLGFISIGFSIQSFTITKKDNYPIAKKHSVPVIGANQHSKIIYIIYKGKFITNVAQTEISRFFYSEPEKKIKINSPDNECCTNRNFSIFPF